jgi:hypothetical protein
MVNKENKEANVVHKLKSIKKKKMVINCTPLQINLEKLET